MLKNRNMYKVLVRATISLIVLHQILPDTVLAKSHLSQLVRTIYNAGLKCKRDRSPVNSRYLIFNNEISKWEELKEMSLIPRNNTIHFLLHGWKENATVNIYSLIAKAYKTAGTSTVLMLDWGPHAIGRYHETICNLEMVSDDLVANICALKSSNVVNPQMIHMVGFSLGAHLAGIAGSKIKRRCGILGRITGLDPAGPLFQGFKRKKRLDRRDAKFVDVIHTNILQSGYFGNIGHIDFYPNGGYFQPGCETILKDVENVGGKMKEKYASCNHRRSIEYFVESILNDAFRGIPCLRCDIGVTVAISYSQEFTYMGESCKHPQKYSSYIVKTRDSTPYGLGPIVGSSLENLIEP